MNFSQIAPGGFPIKAVSALLAAWLLLLIGCGPSEEKLELVPASGVATYKGKPLAGYDIYFKPEGDSRPAQGRTDAAGKFVLGTGGEANGAVVGKFSVYILRPSEDAEVEAGKEEMRMVKPQKSILPSKYETPTTSGITIEVPPGGSDALKIAI